MNSIFSQLSSNKVSILLLAVYAISMAAATFIENDFGTPRARTLVYDALWFEIIMIWLSVNFLVQVNRYKLLSKEKWPIGFFHLGFIVIILGAGITRYTGFEGWAHIREGEKIQHITSAEPFLQVEQKKDGKWNSIFSEETNYKGENFSPKKHSMSNFTIREKTFYARSKPSIKQGNDTLIQLVVATPERIDTWLKLGQTKKIGDYSYSFEGKELADIMFTMKGDSLYLLSPHVLHIQTMNAEFHGAIDAKTLAGVHLRMIYQYEKAAFMIPGFYPNAQLIYEPVPDKKDKTAADYLVLELAASNEKEYRELILQEHNGDSEDWHYLKVGEQEYRVSFGIKSIPLPFSLELVSFNLDRYPGSESPSAFTSNLKVHDTDGHFEYQIFMNNVLDYKGFRFFQASYDTDEKGTVLSVNHDFWGTWVTYFGYALLSVFMIWSLFSPKSRFAILRSKLKKSATLLLLGFVLLSGKTYAISTQADSTDQIVFNPYLLIKPDETIANQFGALVVQDLDGRMKPMNTLALELIRKIYGKTSLKVEFLGKAFELSANQFLLSTQLDGQLWLEIPLIKVSEKLRPDLQTYISKPLNKYLKFNDLLNENGEYRLKPRIEEASQKKPSSQNEADKEFLKLDERFNITYGLITGEFLRMFPHKEDPNHTWFTPNHASEKMSEEDVRFIVNVMPLMSHYIQQNSESSKMQVFELINYVDQFQKLAGKTVYPAQTRLEVELFNNAYPILSRLVPFYVLTGLIWLLISFIHLFKTFSWYSKWHRFGIVMTWLLLFAFTLGMALRWYIAERPPWTDGFEMLLLASWGIVVSGLINGRKNIFTLPLSLLFTGVLLFVAYLDWLNPEITNLVPVLKSYWLKIHVAVIVLGYAPLALSAILSFTSVLLKVIDSGEINQKLKIALNDLSILTELNITIGLYLVTIGTFLGGIWANESWGRYWGWDPKETWALVSIIVYTIVLHLQLIPIKNRQHWFNVMSLWAFSSIIMTSFGVNYYLAGMHSYAKGDPVPIPSWVFWLTGALAILTILSFRSSKEIKAK